MEQKLATRGENSLQGVGVSKGREGRECDGLLDMGRIFSFYYISKIVLVPPLLFVICYCFCVLSCGILHFGV